MSNTTPLKNDVLTIASKEWFGASELAGLPGLPKTDRAVQIRAKGESWQRRARAGRGGGFEYHISSLPRATRDYLGARSIQNTPPVAGGVNLDAAIRTAGLSNYGGLAGNEKQRADARLALLTALDEFTRASELSKSKAMHTFCALWNRGDVSIDGDIRALIPDVHPSTVLRWRKQIKHEGLGGLAGRYGNRRGESKINTQPELAEFVKAMLTDFPHTSAANIYTGVEARFGHRNDIEMPSQSSVERWLKQWKKNNPQLFTAITNPDAFKNKYMAAFGSMSEDVTRPNQLWEMDSSPADVMLVDGRHSLLLSIDVWTRRMKLHVSRTSKANAIAHLIRRALLDWGVPDMIKHDGGADYTSRHVQGVITALEIKPIKCPPFQADRKPHVERAFRTFAHGLVELMPNYIGHNVAERKAIEARRSFADRLMKKGGDPVDVNMTAEQLQTFCDEWCEHLYHNKQHSVLKQSPNQMIANWKGSLIRIEDERALDILVIDESERIVTKKGIRIDNGLYIHPELALRIGDQVRVRRDPEDQGRIYVFDADSQFICVAEDPNVTGISRKLIAEVGRRMQTKRVQDARRELKDVARRVNTKDITREIMEAAKRDNTVAIFPRPSESHNTPGLEGCGVAADSDSGARTLNARPEDLQAIAAELERKPAPAQILDTDNPMRRFQRWQRIELRISAGEYVEPADRDGLQRYQQSDEYRSMKLMAEDFGIGDENAADAE